MLTRRHVTLGTLFALASGARASSASWLPAEAAHARFERIEAETGGRLGVSILDTGSGRSLDWRGTERFALCSTAKVLGCAALLAQVDKGTMRLDQRIKFAASDLVTYSPVTQRHVGPEGMPLGELCEAMITMSVDRRRLEGWKLNDIRHIGLQRSRRSTSTWASSSSCLWSTIAESPAAATES